MPHPRMTLSASRLCSLQGYSAIDGDVDIAIQDQFIFLGWGSWRGYRGQRGTRLVRFR